MTQAARASLRATGQIGMLAAVVNVLVSTAVELIDQIKYVGVLPDEGRLLFLFYYADVAVLVAVGVFVFWASTRPDCHPGHRRIAISASWLGAGIGALQIPLFGLALKTPMSLLLASLTAQMLWPIGACVCLATSYLAGPLGLGESGALRARSPWIRIIAAPAICIDITIMWLKGHIYLPEASVLGVLTVGLLYGLMRRRHPLPGTARWTAATWPLIALMIPSYALNIGIAVHYDNRLGRETIATTATLVILAGVVCAHLANRRLRPESHDLGPGGGPHPTMG